MSRSTHRIRTLGTASALAVAASLLIAGGAAAQNLDRHPARFDL